MIKPVSLTKDLSKAARRELGMSQTDVIKATGIQAWRLKHFEGRGIELELSDLRLLCEFYTSQGVDLEELATHIGQAVIAHASNDPQSSEPKAGRLRLLFSDKLTAEEVDRLMERVETNDDRIGELVKAKIARGFGDEITDESQQQIQELFGTMAENYLIFRLLQGRNVIEAARPEKEARTVGEFVSQWLKNSPVAEDFATVDDGAFGAVEEQE